ncbi:MAG: hypothetical protein IT423_23955, partial [Pirellulaceae bacterium]|nr:hypothetical protein [Pirellulaceae bacterium]
MPAQTSSVGHAALDSRSPRIRPRLRQRLRRLIIESLEDRRLLAFDPAAWNSIRDGLSGKLLPFVDSIDDRGAYTTVLPVIGRSINQIAPIKTLLDENLVSPTRLFIEQNSGAEFAGLVQRLNSLSGQVANLPSGFRNVSSSATGGVNGTEATITWVATLRKTETPRLMAVANSLDTTLIVNELHGLSQTTELTFSITFGVNTISQQFFIRDTAAQEVSLNTWLSIAGVDPNVPTNQRRVGSGQVGNIATSLNIQLDPLVQTQFSLRNDWNNLSSDNPLWIAAQLEEATLNTALYQNSALEGSGTLTADITPLQFAGPTRLFSTSTTMSDGVTNQVSSGGSFSDINHYKNYSPEALSAGIASTAELIARTVRDSYSGANPFRQPLAALGQSWSDLVDVQALLNDSLVAPTRVLFDSQTQSITSIPYRNDAEVLAKLQALTTVPVQVSYTTGEVLYDLTIHRPVSLVAPLNLGLGEELDLPINPSIALTAQTTTRVNFGIRLSDGLFVVKPTAGPTFSMSIPASASIPAVANTRLGFTQISVTGGTVAIAAQADLRLLDSELDELAFPPPNVAQIYGAARRPSSPGWLTASEMIGRSQVFIRDGQQVEEPVPGAINATSVLSSPVTTGGVSVTLNVSGTLPGTTTQFGSITANWSNAFNVTVAGLTASPSIQSLYKFKDIRPSEFVNTGLSESIGLLTQLTTSEALGSNLPLVGTAFTNLLPLDKRLRDAYGQLGTEAARTQLTIQELVQRLGISLGQSIDVQINNDDVRLRIPVILASQSKLLPIAVAQKLVNAAALGDLGFEASGQVNVVFDASATLVVGMSFDNQTPLSMRDVTQRFFVAANNTPSSSGFDASSGRLQFSIHTGSTPIPASISLGLGRLSGSTLTASLGAGSAPATMIVPLKDLPANPDGRLRLAEFKNNLPAAMGTTLVSGEAHVQANLPAKGTQSGFIKLDWNTLDQTLPVITPSSNIDLYTLDAVAFSRVGVQQGLDAILGMLQGWMKTPALNQKVPGLNQTLRELLQTPLSNIVNYFTFVKNANPTTGSTLDAAIKSSATLIPFLQITALESNTSSNRFRYRVTMNFDQTINRNADFGNTPDDKLSFLKLVKALNPRLQALINFEFGYSLNTGFYVAPRTDNVNAKEFVLSVSLANDQSQALGTLGPISIGAVGGLEINAQAELDLFDPNQDQVITTT